MKLKNLTFLLIISVFLISIGWFGSTKGASQDTKDCLDADVPNSKEGEPFVSVYFDPEWNRENYAPLTTCEVATQANLIILTTSEKLYEFVASHPAIAALYLTASGLHEVDASWLQNQYQSGVLIVALNVSHSTLGNKLGVAPEFEDVQVELLPENFVYYSLYGYSNLNEETTIRQSADFRPTFESIPPIVERYALELRVEN